ncbi:MAG: ATP-grasp domain-containing protein [Clostridiales bacterium]|nr:ATP-grasp domain-containing protein [Clostridiales bacterium]
MTKILILGASIYQVPLIRAAKRMGLYTIVSSIPGDYPGFRLADKAWEINTTDREAILAAAQAEGIDGICTTGTDVAVSTIGYVCGHMGLRGISEQAALMATDKADMKEAFRQGDVSTAEFHRAYSLTDVKTAAQKIGFPVVVKRVDSSGSRGITIVHDPNGLEDAYREAAANTRRPYVIVEKMMGGVEIGVDGVIQNGKLVFFAPHEKFLYRSGRTTIPAGHGLPYHGSERVQREIGVQMDRAVKTLGLDNCSFNADVLVDGETVSVLEMGGRTGATCIPELISTYYGINFYEKILQNALGIPLDFTPQAETCPCMAKLLMSPVDGVITGIDEDGLAAVRQACTEVMLDYPVGHPEETMQNGTTRIGHVVAPACREEALDGLIDRVYRCISVNGKSLEELWNEQKI